MINFYKINLKYLIIGVAILSILIIAGALLFSYFNKAKPTPGPLNPSRKPVSTPAPPAAQGPISSSFTVTVKEVKEGKLFVETEEETSQTLEIPLDKNVTFVAWVYKDGKNKPPTRQEATSADLKINQKLEIFETEVADKQTIYEITILNL